MKLGLVVEGGASRVYFATGVMDALLRENIRADYVIGVSAGIANAISYVSGQIGRNIEIGERWLCDKRYMGLRHFFNPNNRSYYNVGFVFGSITDFVPFDYDAYNNAECKTVAVVTNVKSGNAEYIDMTKRSDWTPLIASCALPLLFPPVALNGGIYMDGGIADPLPIDRAIDEGCDKIIVITSREREYKKGKESGLGIIKRIYRSFPEFTSRLERRAEIYNSSHEKALQYEKEGKIFLISPENTETWRRTERNPQKIRAMHTEGVNTATRLLPKLREYLEK